MVFRYKIKRTRGGIIILITTQIIRNDSFCDLEINKYFRRFGFCLEEDRKISVESLHSKI